MSPILTGTVGIAILFILIALRMPIGFAMGIVGFAGFTYMSSLGGALHIL